MKHIMTSNPIHEQMKEVREFASLFAALRSKIGIPNRQPLLDFAFGWTGEVNWFSKEHTQILGEDVNLWKEGRPFHDRNVYWGMDTVKPKGSKWSIHEENGRWVALDTTMPEWLKEIGDERKAKRDEILKRKELERKSS